MLKVENITKSFGNLKAVDGVSFEAKDGEVVGLLGPNGAGKTTTMRVITGFISPDEGNVEIDNISLKNNPIHVQSKIGYLPENNPLYKEMLVSEMLEFSADMRNLTKSQRKDAVDFSVNASNIKEVYYKPINELSKGYKQRVGLAVALLHKPKTLVLDEPTEGLDPNQRSEIRALIKNLSKDRTIIISTHVMQEVEAICDRALIINKGKMVADSSVKDLNKLVKGKSSINVDIEGSNVISSLRAISGIETINVWSEAQSRYSARIVLNEDVKIQPEISRIARENSWVIWKLVEENMMLEDVFRELTK
ncbi:hypothetical protein A3F07_01735 [candidate division WWE3 bacterium RIFCSPHIGHO2_12_FULL_38_15]|uniref:ABC transporter domain-containing protein n=1 Tax=candidate division WWE3 bacterium RIFCSPHIGHO2_02_FULL_38_14 TaxID=1802620 RepID=A0A1F4V9N3_UNCKA|nr:MAG: hypothetical protein A2793_01565 [candidate division WWE3 bacterium RIFCSPHIGHO2_01_FULL_38_45]OGC48425.1 MAG: hypothetical protein A3F07_01735 [candidate division WWE3 bacterium RIFCSPHIGHO2_12_FULL_38_15]OGC53600.1 MAG: hypothetical protein A3D91_04120 [candidate division WWE3 bacterium RIFCSPHIGHO2_02_FULL_38_14]OGC54358.1 MAG: hypothetical protein A3B64_02530 [candidate division WWE3 bacterium RIFCSPLOWO2_01_FULL_37_24]HLB51603.1 ATP-binding cassette domain-containing protein [Pates